MAVVRSGEKGFGRVVYGVGRCRDVARIFYGGIPVFDFLCATPAAENLIREFCILGGAPEIFKYLTKIDRQERI